MTATSDDLKRRRELIAIKKKHGLTYAEIAVLARCSEKLVERWLATPGCTNWRRIPAHRMELIEHNLVAKKNKEKKP